MAGILDHQQRSDETKSAFDLVNLGEHLCYLSNSLDQAAHDIAQSIATFTELLEKSGFKGTRAAAKSIERTTVGELQHQMKAISSSLYTEATAKQGAFMKLGEFLWYLRHPRTSSPTALESGINGFLEQLEKCGLQTRKVAEPLERFPYMYLDLPKQKLVLGASLNQLASIVRTIRHHLEHETRSMTIDR